MVQLLGSIEGKEISEQLIEELSKEIPDSDQETLEQTSTARSSSGILSRLPVMEATYLEAIRYYIMSVQGVRFTIFHFVPRAYTRFPLLRSITRHRFLLRW